MRVPLLELEGKWAEAERLATAVSGETRGLMHYRMMALRHLATLAWLRGDAERVRWAVHECLPTGSVTEPGAAWPFDVVTALQRVAAGLALDDGDLAAAKTRLEAHDRWLTRSEAVLGFADGQALWARYYRQIGDTERAYRHAQQAATDASEPRQPLTLLAARRLLGELYTDDAEYLERVRGYHETAAYKKAMRKRKVWIEPLFGEAKQWHGMRQFRLRGLQKVNMEGLLIAAGQNLKRLLCAQGWGRRLWPDGTASFAALWSKIRVLPI